MEEEEEEGSELKLDLILLLDNDFWVFLENLVQLKYFLLFTFVFIVLFQEGFPMVSNGNSEKKRTKSFELVDRDARVEKESLPTEGRAERGDSFNGWRRKREEMKFDRIRLFYSI